MTRVLFRIQSLVVFIMLIMAAFPAGSFGQPNAFSKIHRHDLDSRISTDGNVHVIVGVAVQSTPGGAPSSTDRQKHRAAVGESQKGFLKRIAGPGVHEIRRFEDLPFVTLKIDTQGLAKVLADEEVVSVEEDLRLEPHLINTPGIVEADLAWAVGYKGGGQTVAVLDTGVDLDHPFFAGKVADEACFSTQSNGRLSLCPNGQSQQFGPGAGMYCPDLNIGCYHGTHVAGIAVGQEGRISGGGAGMAPAASLMPIQVFSKICGSNGCSLGASTSNLISAMQWVYNQHNTFKIASVNMSLGGGGYTGPCDTMSPAMKSAIDLLRSVNIATVVSAGNDGFSNKLSFPACISSAVSVGAMTKQNSVTSFSNAASFLSLLAPGQSIYSAYPGGGYVYLSGTSMAAPHVAGAWAVMKSARPTSTVQEILNAFQATGLPITDPRQGLVKPLLQIGDSSQGALSTLLSPSDVPLNHALAANGGVASASSSYNTSYPVMAVNNSDRTGKGWGSGGGWNDATSSAYPDWVQINFSGPKAISEVDVFTLQDNYASPVAPTQAMTFSLYGITAFDVQYWTGAAWATVPGGSISGNASVWRRIQFAPITTSKLRVVVNGSLSGYSRITEIEAWGTAASSNQPPTVNLTLPAPGATFATPAAITLSANASDTDGTVARVEFFQGAVKLGEALAPPYTLQWSNVSAGSYTLTAVATDNLGSATASAPVAIIVTGSALANHALAANGGVASASSFYSTSYPVTAVNNGDRTGKGWGNGGGWNDATSSVYPDWIQIDFNGPKAISEVDVFTLQDNYTSPVAPTQAMTFSLYGITAFNVQYWTGAAWATVPGGSISGNASVWRRIQFAPVTTSKIRVVVNNSLASYSRITEIEAWGM